MNYDIIEIVIDKLVRTFKLKEWQYDVDSLVEDIAEALKLIGAAKVYEDNVAVVTVNSMVIKLPAGCQAVKQLGDYLYYKESGNFLTVDQPDGTELTLIYQSMPLDSRGFPLVPDNAAAREAIMWYMVKNLVLQGEITKVSFETAEDQWQWRCGSARADLSAMDITAWNKVAENFRRLNPIKNAHENNYEQLNIGNTLDREKYRFSWI